MPQRLSQILSFGNIEGDEFQNPILRDDADNHGSMRLIIYVDKWYSAGF